MDETATELNAATSGNHLAPCPETGTCQLTFAVTVHGGCVPHVRLRPPQSEVRPPCAAQRGTQPLDKGGKGPQTGGRWLPRSYRLKQKPSADNVPAGTHAGSPRGARGPSIRDRPSVMGPAARSSQDGVGRPAEQTPVRPLTRRGAMARGVFVFCFFNLGRRTGLRGPRGRGQQTQLPFVHLSGLALGSWQPSGNLRARAGLTWPRPFKNV